MSTTISVKLLIDKRTSRVLFAEAGKDFVDFLFTLLAIPIGTVIKLLTKQSMVGCIGELYESVQNLSHVYMQSRQDKIALLEPKTVFPSTSINLLTLENAPVQTPKYYACSRPRHYCNSPNITSLKGHLCPSCGSEMDTDLTIVGTTTGTATSSQGDGKRGYVKDVVTYMITDDLVVTPMSTISGLTLINKFSIKDVSTLEENVVAVGMEEGLKLLRASLESKTVLTDVFLGKQCYPTAKDKA